MALLGLSMPMARRKTFAVRLVSLANGHPPAMYSMWWPEQKDSDKLKQCLGDVHLLCNTDTGTNCELGFILWGESLCVRGRRLRQYPGYSCHNVTCPNGLFTYCLHLNRKRTKLHFRLWHRRWYSSNTYQFILSPWLPAADAVWGSLTVLRVCTCKGSLCETTYTAIWCQWSFICWRYFRVWEHSCRMLSNLHMCTYTECRSLLCVHVGYMLIHMVDRGCTYMLYIGICSVFIQCDHS